MLSRQRARALGASGAADFGIESAAVAESVGQALVSLQPCCSAAPASAVVPVRNESLLAHLAAPPATPAMPPVPLAAAADVAPSAAAPSRTMPSEEDDTAECARLNQHCVVSP